MISTPISIKEILQTNKQRLDKLLNKNYDPLRGIGSPIHRINFRIDDDMFVKIPDEMAENPVINKILSTKSESLLHFAKDNGIDFNSVLDLYNKIREVYDFEYLAAMYLKIQDKETKKMTPFVMNTAQLKYFTELERQRKYNDIIRIKLLKTRQWGGSTLTENYIAWRQCYHGKNLHSVLAGDVEGQAKNMFTLYKRAIKSMPSKYTLAPHEGSSKNRILEERGNIISIGSMRNPDSLRSSDNSILHATEIGLWKSTANNKPEDLMQSLVNSIEIVPQTMIILESTAKGVGNYWHNIWQEDNIYKPVFVAWFEAVKNIVNLTDEQRIEVYESLNDDEQRYWELGATLDGIAWYRKQLKSMSGDKWRMQAENPATPNEAFQGTGNRVFPISIVEGNKIFIRKPELYNVYSNAQTGREALQGVHIEKSPVGQLKVWKDVELEPHYSNRYVVSVDIGGASQGADYSVITVIDRIGLIDGGCEEIVARARIHTTHYNLAWLSARIATYYSHALLVIENNSLKPSDAENGYLTVLSEISHYYNNLYTYMSPEKVKESPEVRWGFFTNHSTKSAIINELYKRLETGSVIEYDEEMFAELDVYEIDTNGKYNAAEGYHDDIIMSTAIGLHISAKTSIPLKIERATKSVHSRATLDIYSSE